MSALTDLYQRIAVEIDRTDSASAIEHAVASAIMAHKHSRLGFNERGAAFSMAQGQWVYEEGSGIPGDILDVDLIVINSLSPPVLLKPSLPSRIASLDHDNQSRPALYARHGKRFMFYPTPDSNYGAEIRYLSDVDDETWATRAESLVRCRAKRELYAHLLWDYEAAQQMALMEAAELRSLMRGSMLKMSSGRVVPELPM